MSASTKSEREEQIEKAAPDMYLAINAVLNSPSHKDDQCEAFKKLRAAKDEADGVQTTMCDGFGCDGGEGCTHNKLGRG